MLRTYIIQFGVQNIENDCEITHPKSLHRCVAWWVFGWNMDISIEVLSAGVWRPVTPPQRRAGRWFCPVNAYFRSLKYLSR